MSATNENTPTSKLNVIAAPPNTVSNHPKTAPKRKKKKQNDTIEEPVAVDNIIPPKSRCCVINCKNTYRSCQLFTFPDDKRLHQWKELTGVGKGRQRKHRHLFICADHFKEDDFVIAKKKLALSKTAIPSENLPKVHPRLDTSAEVISGLSNTALKLDEIIKEIELYKKYKGTYNDVQLNFYISYPNAYKLLEKPLNLMEKTELKKACSNFKTLHPLMTKKMAVMSPKQKVCILSQGKVMLTPKVFYDHKFDKLMGLVSSEFDSNLSHPADMAQFLVVSGLYQPWHIFLDIAYFDEKKKKFTRNWIAGLDNALKDALRSNVKVLILLPDYTITGANIYMLKPMHCKPFQLIETFKSGSQTVILFDVQFLLMALFYFLKKAYFLIPDLDKSQSVELSHLLLLVSKDEKNKCPLLPNLTAYHIEPNTFEELRLETVLEIFSVNTVSALEAYIELDLITEEATGTLIFIRKMTSFIDLCKGKIQDQSEAISILSDVEVMLSKLQVCTLGTYINIDPEYTAISYLMITIKTLKNLVVNDSELFTAVSKHLLNNYTQKFCDIIRNKSRGEKPTAKIVDDTFKLCKINNLFKPLTQKEVDFNDAIDLFIEQLRTKITNTIFTYNLFKLDIKPSEHKIYLTDRSDKLVYISSYLLKKCADIHTCERFKKYLKNTNNYTISSLKYDVAKGDCLIPKNDFIEFIEILEMVFLNYFTKFVFKPDLFMSLIKALGQIGFLAPCSCFPIFYMVQLFVWIRIDHIIKCSNLEIKLKKRLPLEPVSLFFK